MEYQMLNKEELIAQLMSLKALNAELLREKELESRLDFPWTGNLGHWYWYVKTNEVTFNPMKVAALGFLPREVPKKVDYQFFTDRLHPEDYEKTMEAMRAHLRGEAHVYEVEYRIRAKDGSYKWYYDRGRITQYDENGKPLFLAGIVFDITEKKQQIEALEEKNKALVVQSHTDGLTSLANYRALIEFLQDEAKLAFRNNEPLSIALFDLDHFKNVNDTHGHLVGDHVLTKVASIIAKHVRSSDLAGRYGGEEFMVILKNTAEADARAICNRIVRSVEASSYEAGVKMTISGGLSQYHGESLSDFINNADSNLYEAKRLGRNRVV